MAQVFRLIERNRSSSPPFDDYPEDTTDPQWLTVLSSSKRASAQYGGSTLLLALVVVFIAFNLKHFPGAWHMRILNGFRFVLRTQRPTIKLSHSHIFQPMIISSKAELLEIDFNLHKTNSSYFADLDICRSHLVCTLFSKGIEKMRGGTAAYTGSKQPTFGLALGAVSCNFRKEVAPYQNYEMWSRILSWDEKWIYIVTHFVRKDAVQPKSFSLYPTESKDYDGSSESSYSRRSSLDSTISGGGADEATSASLDMHFTPEKGLFATALSKCVFKSGRKTISPEAMFRMSGLLPATPSSDSVSYMPAAAEDEVEGERLKVELEQIEAQRLEGLKVAQGLASQNQKALEAEFGGTDNGDVLGRHSDGAGIVGVVATLLQLAGLKRHQVL